MFKQKYCPSRERVKLFQGFVVTHGSHFLHQQPVHHSPTHLRPHSLFFFFFGGGDPWLTLLLSFLNIRFSQSLVNAPWFDRWLPRAAAIRELGERGMMSLTVGERLRRRKALELLKVVTGQKCRSEGADYLMFITKAMCYVYEQHKNTECLPHKTMSF